MERATLLAMTVNEAGEYAEQVGQPLSVILSQAFLGAAHQLN